MEPGGDPGGAVASTHHFHDIGALCAALHGEKIKFQIVGMVAAILQGAPGTTLDTDLWIDLPERQYMRCINLALKLGATVVRSTVVSVKDGRLVNFCYRLDGLSSFRTEYRNSRLHKFEGVQVRVLPLERVIRSKEAAGRDKDLAVLPMLRDIAASRKELGLRQ